MCLTLANYFSSQEKLGLIVSTPEKRFRMHQTSIDALALVDLFAILNYLEQMRQEWNVIWEYKGGPIVGTGPIRRVPRK